MADTHISNTSSIDTDSFPSIVDQNLEVDTDWTSEIGNSDLALHTLGKKLDATTQDTQDYRFENGRRYHSSKDGEYWMPNDDAEANRLDLQHELWRMTIKGSMHLSPLIANSLQNSLDVGTGTGAWVIDLADKYPQTKVIGTDLSPIQPKFAPQNCTFLVENVENEWSFEKNHFDFIHSRFITMGMHDWPKYIKKAYDHLKPGAWLELQEGTAPRLLSYTKDDGQVELVNSNGPFPEGNTYQDWSNTMSGIAKAMNIDTRAHEEFSRWLKEAGFTNIREAHLKWPMGPWPKDPFWKKFGQLNLDNMLSGLEGMSMALLTRAKGWTSEQVQEYLVDVRKDMKDPKTHYYMAVSIHCAQKPFDSEGNAD